MGKTVRDGRRIWLETDFGTFVTRKGKRFAKHVNVKRLRIEQKKIMASAIASIEADQGMSEYELDELEEYYARLEARGYNDSEMVDFCNPDEDDYDPRFDLEYDLKFGYYDYW